MWKLKRSGNAPCKKDQGYEKFQKQARLIYSAYGGYQHKTGAIV
jgi:hypothetical protein